MNLFITSIKRVTTTTPEILYVRIGYGKELNNEYTSVEFDIEIKNIDFMNLTLSQIESIAIERALSLIEK